MDTPRPICRYTLGKPGYFLVGTVITPLYSAGAGGGSSSFVTVRPSYGTDLGARTTGNISYAYDNNTTSYASVTAQSTSSSNTYGSCQWGGWAAYVTTSALNLYVTATSATSVVASFDGSATATISCSLGAVADDSGGAISGTYTVAIPVGTDISTISVTATASTQNSDDDSPSDTSGGHTVSGHITETIQVYEIYIAP